MPGYHIMSTIVGDRDMYTRRRSDRLMVAVAGGAIGFALVCARPAAAQQADQPAADSGSGLEDITVAATPNRPASIELVNGSQSTLAGPPANGDATVAEPKAPNGGIEGFIEGGFGSHGLRTAGGAVTVPLVKDRLQLSVEGYATHAGFR